MFVDNLLIAEQAIFIHLKACDYVTQRQADKIDIYVTRDTARTLANIYYHW